MPELITSPPLTRLSEEEELFRDTVHDFAERESGSDAFGLQTRATRRGDVWILEGRKLWITNGAEAGLFVIFANADFSQGYKGITAFAVERGCKGFTVGKYVKERKQFGHPIGEFQAVQFQLAQAATELEAARLMVYNSARLEDASEPYTMQAAMAKLL